MQIHRLSHQRKDIEQKPKHLFSRGHATLHLAVSVGKFVHHIFEFRVVLQYCPCPTVCDCLAVYPAWFLSPVNRCFCLLSRNFGYAIQKIGWVLVIPTVNIQRHFFNHVCFSDCLCQTTSNSLF